MRGPRGQFAGSNSAEGGLRQSRDISPASIFGRGDDTVANPHRIELTFISSSFSSLILLLKLDRQLPVEQFEATVPQSTVPSPL